MKKANYKKIILALLILLSLIIVQSAWSKVDHKAWQTRPIWLGTSGGNINDISTLYCCSGTLGALVQDAGGQYILSNNHVLAKTNGTNNPDPIIQPGLIDQNCYQDSYDIVANLSRFVTILFDGNPNTVDAAIAAVRSNCGSGSTNCVDPSGSILDIGEVSTSTVVPELGKPVKKSGRTTGLTKGKITAVGVTAYITYNTECGIGSQVAKFINQIMISPGRFSKGGDSGSLIVEDCSSNPRAVGLLFAGGYGGTLANPISDVLSSFIPLGYNLNMVGTTDPYCTPIIKPRGGKEGSEMTAQPQLPPQANQRAVEAVSKVKEKHEEAILRIEGVVGIGVGLSDKEPDQVVIEVYTKKPVHEMKHLIPETLEGIPVKIIETGEIVAY